MVVDKNTAISDIEVGNDYESPEAYNLRCHHSNFFTGHPQKLHSPG